MEDLFSLGELYASDFLAKDKQPDENTKIELALALEDGGAVRLKNPAPPKLLYGHYWYRSGTNSTMREALKDVVTSILEILPVKDGDVWIDVASNDGTLLGFVPKDIKRIGIDPAGGSFKEEAETKSDLVIQDFFSASAYRDSRFGHTKAKVLTSLAVFYDLDDPLRFVKDVHEILDPNGLWVLQLSYTPLMLKQLAFDNICHEHVYYYSLFNLKKILKAGGFDVVDVQLNDVNGGSFRVYCMKEDADKSVFRTRPYRDVCEYRLASCLAYEETLGLGRKETWVGFFNRIQALKKKVVDFVRREREEGKSVWGYGASTKGNTLLQYFGLDASLIDGIAERNEYKVGLRTVGTNIPIYSESQMRQANPDYLLILPWHFIKEFTTREQGFLEAGGKLIVPCPEFEIISAVGRSR